MLEITVPEREWFNEQTNGFETSPITTLVLEHSLVSLSKWESKWEKPFLNNTNSLSREELVDYIQCMTILPKNVNPLIYKAIYEDDQILDKITSYINKKMTATWFSDEKSKKVGYQRPVTGEVIYYWMCKLQIPVEFQKWHLNRLMTLIEVFNAEESPRKKRSKGEMLSSRKALNEKRKKALGTRG